MYRVTSQIPTDLTIPQFASPDDDTRLTNIDTAPWSTTPSYDDDLDPLVTNDELRLLSNFMNSQFISIDRSMSYTSTRLDSLTESIWTALCKAAMSNNSTAYYNLTIQHARDGAAACLNFTLMI